MTLCSDVRLVFDFEIAHGNTVARFDAPAGTECPYAVIFVQPLKILGTRKAEEISPVVKYWECRDTHYQLEAGFVCEKHRHAVASPLVD